jgi:hypothetical protein
MSTMKIINPELLENLSLEDAKVKFANTGISFNKAAVKLLSLKHGSEFVITQDEKDNLYFKDVTNTGFQISAMPEKGGARAFAKNIVKFLYPDKKISFRFYIINEMKDGYRLLSPVFEPATQAKK